MATKLAKKKRTQVLQQDCIIGMQNLPASCIDLAFADPPFNIGYEYDTYKDNLSCDAYLEWSREWASEVIRILKPDGTFWLAIGDEYAAELKVMFTRELGLTCRSWVIWYYTFGVNCKNKFSRSHAHLFHFVKDPEQFTFNADDPGIRIPSARQLVYGDKRANPKGRLPDDTWILRPQDVPESFSASEDTWYFPRVNGTFKERKGWHGCQMPEQLLGRIIRACSNDGDLVFDPFTGSGTTLAVAKKLQRDYLGFELSEEYAANAKARLADITPGDALEGTADPLTSAPTTDKGRKLGEKPKRSTEKLRTVQKKKDVAAFDTEVIVEAFSRIHDGWSTDYIVANSELNSQFVEICHALGSELSASEINRLLFHIRKAGKLLPIASKRFSIHPEIQLDFSFASEIAAKQVCLKYGGSLDDVLCAPEKAIELDRVAGEFAPGYSSLYYRWAALNFRKKRKTFEEYADRLSSSMRKREGRLFLLDENLNFERIPHSSGVYRVVDEEGGDVYTGVTADFRRWASTQFDSEFRKAWDSRAKLSALRIVDGINVESEKWGLRTHFIGQYAPRLNYDIVG